MTTEIGRLFQLQKDYKADKKTFFRGLAVRIVDVVFAGWVKIVNVHQPDRQAMVRRSDLRDWPKDLCHVCRRNESKTLEFPEEALCCECTARPSAPQPAEVVAPKVLPQEDDMGKVKSEKGKGKSKAAQSPPSPAGKSGGMAAAVAGKKPRGRKVDPPSDVEVTNVRKSRTKQSTMSDIVSPSIPEVEEAADMYCDLRDERIKWGVKEKEAKTHLIEMMKKHNLANYPYDGRLVQFQAAMDEEVKVKDVKKKAHAEDGGDDDGDDDE